MTKIVCVNCNTAYIPEENGVCILDHDVTRTPYQLFFGDRIKCPSCRVEVVICARYPFLQRHNNRFHTVIAEKRAENQIIDVYAYVYEE